MSERIFRVMVGERLARVEGAAKHYEPVWVECTQAQAMRYASGDPDWRTSGEPQSSLLERFTGWLRGR